MASFMFIWFLTEKSVWNGTAFCCFAVPHVLSTICISPTKRDTSSSFLVKIRYIKKFSLHPLIENIILYYISTEDNNTSILGSHSSHS